MFLFCVTAVQNLITLSYADGRPVKPGDVVTGTIDCGSFPAEPFLAQLVDIFPSNGCAEIVFLKRTPALCAAARFFQRQTNVAKAIVEIHIPLEKLTLRCRASRPISRDAREYQPIPRPGRIAWGSHRSFGYRL
ncbi:MAG: hypothetical protein WA384_00415 [Rhodomicrobium sp.]